MSTAPTNIREKFVWFVQMREAMRASKESGRPGPHSPDPILANHHFCNINREHDRVTRWIHEHVRKKICDMSLNHLVPTLLVCRIFNEPECLAEVLPDPRRWTPAGVLAAVQARRARGDKAMRGAYLMVPHGINGKGQKPEAYYLRVVDNLMMSQDFCVHRLERVAERLMSVGSIGDFVSNQVCTDLRYVPGYGWQETELGEDGWDDWLEFVLGGPGTRRGLNRYLGATSSQAGNRKFPKLVGPCQPHLLQIREEIQPLLPIAIQEYFMDPNNLSNSFCEFDKYCRAEEQVQAGKPFTLRHYKPYTRHESRSSQR